MTLTQRVGEGGGLEEEGDDSTTLLANGTSIGARNGIHTSSRQSPLPFSPKHWINPRSWGMGTISLVLLMISLVITSIILLAKGPRGLLESDHPSLRVNDHLKPDPSFYTDFVSQLILRGGNEDWVSFDPSMADHYFTPEEMSTLPEPGAKEQVCEVEGLPKTCCLGAFSLAGIMVWDPTACARANYYKFQVPHRGIGLGHYRDMGDVLQALGNRSITFIGDSLASQHAHAMECSWLRTGKTKTLGYEKVDLNRIFGENGTAFSRAGRYGTNAYYTWWTETDGIQATVKLLMQYRPEPDMNETLTAMAQSDVMIVNFGLHYLMKERHLLIDEMTNFLETLKSFAATPGKILIWRETSAQHHLGEGGEFPLVDEPERMGMKMKEYKDEMGHCHSLRFGAHIAPQWRDKLILQVADKLGYQVHFLGSYEGLPSVNGRRRRGNNATCTHVRASGELIGLDPSQQDTEKPILYWLPFFRISSERTDLHPYNPWRQKFDCTHFCFTPLLWDPLVDGLAAAVDDAQRREESRC